MDLYRAARGLAGVAAAAVAEALSSSGWATTVAADVRTEIWRKLVLNAATLPTAALTGMVAGELGRSDAMAPLVERVAREAVAVARAMGLSIDADERVTPDLADEISARYRLLCETSGFAENFDAHSGAALRDRAYTWTASAYLILAAAYEERVRLGGTTENRTHR